MNILVFGSNLAGRHGKGAALEAVNKWGAIYGLGVGIQGKSFAIPTKDYYLRTLDLDEIEAYVNLFIKYVRKNPRHNYPVTQIGCGLAGYTPRQIAPLFHVTKSMPQVFLPVPFLAELELSLERMSFSAKDELAEKFKNASNS